MAPPTTQPRHYEVASKTTRPTRPTGGHAPHTATLLNCAKTCNETLNYCIQQGGNHVQADHLRAMIDCAQVCALGADLAGRDSQLWEAYKAVCAEACKACEESCEAFEGDRTMQACADACRECYEACSA